MAQNPSGRWDEASLKSMASNFLFETRDQRIYRMIKNNPNKPEPLCIAAVDEIWRQKREGLERLIPERFRDASIADLGYMTGKVITAMEDVLAPPTRNFNDPVGLVFCGPAGSGKSHTAYALLRWVADRNPERIVYVDSYAHLVQDLRGEFSSDAYTDLGATWDILNNISGLYPGLIFIDDLSSQKPTDFETDKLMMFLETRVNNYMPFFITTNVRSMDFASVFGERLASRLAGYSRIIDFETFDKRFPGSEKKS